MSSHLSPESRPTEEQDNLRVLNRSPHPYHHQSSELPHPSEQPTSRRQGTASSRLGSDSTQPSPSVPPTYSKESTPASDSGTDADDEHFLKGLPPPKLRPHKGLRGKNEVISGTSTPVLSPAVLQEPVPAAGRKASLGGKKSEDKATVPDAIRRRKILVQRALEAGIIITLARMIQANKLLSPVLDTWRKGIHPPFVFLGQTLTTSRLLSIQRFVRRTALALPLSSRAMGLQASEAVFKLAIEAPYSFRSRASPLSSFDYDICVAISFRQLPGSHPSEPHTEHKLNSSASDTQIRPVRSVRLSSLGSVMSPPDLAIPSFRWLSIYTDVRFSYARRSCLAISFA